MRNSALRPKGRFCAAFGLTLVAAALVHGQANAPGGAARTADQVYKNIQVLKGIPAEEIGVSMHLIGAALGVECEYCHEEDRAADTKLTKQTARKMMQMMNAINQANFAGRQEVTCFTCHQGRPDPRNAPVFPLDSGEESTAAKLPSVDQIVGNYIEALGGEQALRKVTSRVISGTQYIPTGPGGTMPIPATLERYQKAPNLIANVYHAPTYTIVDGFDGAVAWSQDFRGRVIEAGERDQARAKREADFYLPLNLKKQYIKMEVSGIERINDRDAFVVIATPPNDLPERLYFDTQTGLLLRNRTVLSTPVGESPFEVNYSDYRDTGSGVKFPYVITMNPAGSRMELETTATIRVSKVQDNAPIDSSKFAKPKSEPAAPR